MACFRQDDGKEELFSPVRFSLADSSIGSGGSVSSITSIERGLSFKDTVTHTTISQFSDVGLEEENIFSPISESCSLDKISKKSSLSTSPLTSSKNFSTISANSTKLSTDLKKESANLRRMGKNKNTSANGNSNKNLENQMTTTESRERKASNVSGQNDKKLARPTTFINLNKRSESSNLKEDKKIQNKAIKNSSISKKIQDVAEVCSDISEKNTLNENSTSNGKSFSIEKCEEAFVSQMSARGVNSTQSSVSEKSQKLEDSNFTSSALFPSEVVVTGKMIHDCVRIESDKVRQNMVSQQMAFYSQLNKIKDNMEHQHLATTDCLYKIIENLLKENLTLRQNI